MSHVIYQEVLSHAVELKLPVAESCVQLAHVVEIVLCHTVELMLSPCQVGSAGPRGRNSAVSDCGTNAESLSSWSCWLTQ